MDAPPKPAVNDQSTPGLPEAVGVSRRGHGRDSHPNRTNGGKRIFCRVLPKEHADLAKRASEAGLSMSEFIRRVVKGHATYSRYDYDVLEKLAAVHADMSRLGNLFKMALGQKDATGEAAYSGYERTRILSVLASIESNQELLRNHIAEFRT